MSSDTRRAGRSDRPGEPGHPSRPGSLAPAAVPGRVAWLLRVNRLYADDEHWAVASRFAEAFHGGSWPRPASESTISRWETGALRAPYLAVRRYEELLRLPHGGLVSTIDTILRYAAPAGRPVSGLERPAQDSPGGVDRIEDLVDRACGTGEMSGADWDELTTRLAAAPTVVLVPRTTWSRLAERLLSEMIIADGVAWMTRFESLGRLLGHPIGEGAAVATCAQLAADPANQVVVEVICALDMSRHPDASRHVLSQLRHPTREAAQYGALLACVRKLRQGHFTPAQTADLAALAGEFVTDPTHRLVVRPLAAEVLRLAPAAASRRVLERLRRHLAGHPALENVLTEGRLASREAARPVVDRLAHAVVAGLPRHVPGFTDRLLPELLDELLYSPVPDVRLYTALLLAASPYRAPLARALAAELVTPGAVHDVGRMPVLLGALRILGTAAERPLVERLIIDGSLPPHVATIAAHAIGHIGGRSEDRFWLHALHRHARQWERERGGGAAATLRGLVYALGIADNRPLLSRVRGDVQLPAPARTAATWWLDIPELILASSRQ